MKCPRCHHENPTPQKFCGACGAPFGAAGAGSHSELEAENQRLRRSLAEGSDQQTATSQILKVISRSPAEMRPVFETIVNSAVTLCDAAFGALFRYDGQLITIGALSSQVDSAERGILEQIFPRRVTPGGRLVGRAVREKQVVQIEDVQADADALGYGNNRRLVEASGYRTFLAVPLLRGDVCFGVINLWRRTVAPFSEQHIALLQTFADQAVIAIENVRLFNETKEALDRQTATSEILRVISSSPTDLQPVLDTVAESAARLCDAADALIYRLDGDRLRLVAKFGSIPVPTASLPLTRGLVTSRAVIDRRTLHIEDLAAQLHEFPEAEIYVQEFSHRTLLITPLLRESVALGAIAIRRTEVQPFSDGQIDLLKTFADQAVIAIENVRLFKELERRNRDLAAALDQQTATAEVLRVISRSQTDVQPVFDAIVDNAMRLFRPWAVAVMRSDGRLLHLIAARGGVPGTEEYLRRQSPWPIEVGLPASRCVLDRSVIHIPDVEADRTLDEGIRDLARTRGYRSVLAAPMLRDGQPIGALTITRAERGPFSSAEIELLQTFADQAVIAVENARLLGELRARTTQLTRTVDELKALADVSRALSSTLELDAVLQTIVTRAGQLAGTDACSVFEYDEAIEAFQLRATNNLDEEVTTLARQTPIRKGEGVQGRMALTRQPVQVPDISQEDAYHGPLRDVLLRTGTRAVLAVPMLRENELIGGLTVNKRTPGAFAPEIIELLTTFATQSALAIQNARLFREIEQKSRELEAASRHKSEFLANMSHELRTPLNAVIGFSEVLNERMFGELNEKQADYLKDIHASGQHLLSLINDILDLSKIEAGRMELELSEFDLPMTIDNALMLVRERASRRGIELHRTVDERLGQIQADERKIRQVLLNLLSNAIKFTPEGGRIEVLAVPVDDSVEVSVRDTGVGIAPEDQGAIFEEFKQVGTASKKVEGTGLGLALSRKFIELHGGRIWVKSQIGTGATFTFTLPMQAGPGTEGREGGQEA